MLLEVLGDQSLQQRAEIRAGAAKDPSGKWPPHPTDLILTQENDILIPVRTMKDRTGPQEFGGLYELRMPFHNDALDTLFSSKRRAVRFEEITERCGVPETERDAFAAYFTTEPGRAEAANREILLRTMDNPYPNLSYHRTISPLLGHW